jgi:hypothetical protein
VGVEKGPHIMRREVGASQVAAQGPRLSVVQGSWPQTNANLVKVVGSGPDQVLEERGDNKKREDSIPKSLSLPSFRVNGVGK